MKISGISNKELSFLLILCNFLLFLSFLYYGNTTEDERYYYAGFLAIFLFLLVTINYFVYRKERTGRDKVLALGVCVVLGIVALLAIMVLIYLNGLAGAYLH